MLPHQYTFDSSQEISSDLIRPTGTYTLLCNCRRQLFDLNSLRGAPPSQGKAGKRIATSAQRPPRNDIFLTQLLCNDDFFKLSRRDTTVIPFLPFTLH